MFYIRLQILKAPFCLQQKWKTDMWRVCVRKDYIVNALDSGWVYQDRRETNANYVHNQKIVSIYAIGLSDLLW